MRQPYIVEKVRKTVADAEDYFYSDRVPNGKILIIRNLCAYWSAIATTEEAHFFVEDAGRKIYLGDDVALDTGGKPGWSGRAVIGEGDRAGVYVPDSATGDIIYFWIVGELLDAEHYHDS